MSPHLLFESSCVHSFSKIQNSCFSHASELSELIQMMKINVLENTSIDKKRGEKRHDKNIIKETRVEDRFSFLEMFCVGVLYF